MVLDNATAELILNAPTLLELEQPNATLPVLQLASTRFVLRVVRRLDALHQFRNFIYYISDYLRLATDKTEHLFSKFWSIFLTSNVIVRHNYNGSLPMSHLISTPALVLVYTTGPKDPIMEVAAQSLTGIRWLKTIFVLFPAMTTTDQQDPAKLEILIQNIYDWAWKKQFTNTLLITLRENIFIQEPYPRGVLINKTAGWDAAEFFEHYVTNMKGYIIRTPIIYDLPRVFLSDRPANIYEQSLVHGTSGNLFVGFLQYVNATLLDTTSNYTFDYLNLKFFVNLLNQGVYEILIHSYTDMARVVETSHSYPIGITDWCFMVPYSNRSSEYMYLLKTMKHSTWFLLLLTMLYMSLALYWCTPQRPRDLGAALLQTISTLTSNTPISIIKQSTLRMRYMYFMFFVMGIITTTMYTSKMTSFFTASTYQQQIKTVQDVIDANLRILVLDTELEYMLKRPEQFPTKFLAQLDVVTKKVFDIYRDPFNTDFGYTVPTDRWEFLIQQQEHLSKPIFHLTDICSGPFYHIFPMPKDSHLRQIFHRYILKTQEAGLMQQWSRVAFREALHLGVIKLRITSDEPLPLSFKYFLSAYGTWCFGLVLGGLVFGLEMKWYQYVILGKKHKKRLNKKTKPRNVKP